MLPARQFESLEKEFFKGWVSRNPLFGSMLGMHEFDDKLPAAGVEKIFDDVKFLKATKAKLAKINPRSLTPRRSRDHAILNDMLRRQIALLDDVRLWERIPEAPRFVGESVYQILGRTYAPLQDRFQAIMARMEKLPKYIRGSVSKLKNPAKMFVENELESVTRLAGFFYKIREIAKENLKRRDLKRMMAAVEGTQDSMEELCDTLVIDILPDATDEWAMSDAHYRRALKAIGVTQSPDQIIQHGERAYNNLQRKLRDFARRIRRKTAPEDIRDAIKSRHPASFEEVLDFTRDTVKRARQFIQETKILSMPTNESIFIIDTPTYLRNREPLSNVWPPGKFEKSQQGYLFLTPPDCDSSRLREHNYASLSNMVVRLAYPGRHLQQVSANRSSSLIRSMIRDPLAAGGWPRFCESKMKECGFDDTPEIQFMQMCDEISDTVRAVLDVKLSTGRLTPKEAVSHLAVHTGMDWVCAEAEIREIQLHPTGFVARLLGGETYRRLESKTRSALGQRYTDRFFHDSILSSGVIPLGILEHELDERIEAQKRKLGKVKAKKKKSRPARKRKPARKPAAKKRKKTRRK